MKIILLILPQSLDEVESTAVTGKPLPASAAEALSPVGLGLKLMLISACV